MFVIAHTVNIVMEGNRKKVYTSTYLLILQTKLVKTKARNGVIHRFQLLCDVSKFNSVFKLISQVSCQGFPTSRKKKPQPDYKQSHPVYKGKRCEIRE